LVWDDEGIKRWVLFRAWGPLLPHLATEGWIFVEDFQLFHVWSLFLWPSWVFLIISYYDHCWACLVLQEYIFVIDLAKSHFLLLYLKSVTTWNMFSYFHPSPGTTLILCNRCSPPTDWSGVMQVNVLRFAGTVTPPLSNCETYNSSSIDG
jgi:hypothetical protein